MKYQLIDPFFGKSLFDVVFRDEPFFSNEKWSTPKVNVAEKDDRYLLSVDLPGMKKEEVKIDLKDNILTISGERKSEHKEEKDNYYRSEVSYGKFSRSFNVEGVDTEKISAKYEDGVLKLELEKSKEQKPKEISVQ